MKQLPLKPRAKQLGFSLSQTSIALAVSGLLLAAVIPGSGSNDDDAKVALTKQRMLAIEEATKKFMESNYRRPCPADGTLAVTDASDNFGKEKGTAGACASPSPNFGPVLFTLTGVTSSYMVAGAVPVRALGLPDEYALDGFGRRMMYIVDRQSTDATTCRDRQSQGLPGLVRIRSASTDTAAKDYVMAALISYGKDGHGAFPAAGSTVANRVNSYTNDANSQMNAFNTGVGATLTTSFTTGAVVQREASSTFDDIVYYDESVKDKCCIGARCSQGFRLNGNAGSLDAMGGINFVTGDSNGDGQKDFLAVANYGDQSQPVTVVQYQPTGWPAGINGSTVSTYQYWYIQNDPRISYFGYSMAAGDVTGDGMDDLVILGESMGIIVYLSPMDYTGDIVLPIGNIIDGDDYGSGVDFEHSGTGKPGAVAIGDIDNDSFKDVIFSTVEYPAVYGTGSEVGVIFGRDARDFTKTVTIGDSDSFYILSDGSLGWMTEIATGIHSIGTGDFNGDGITDVIFGSPRFFLTTGAVFGLYGRDRSSWANPHLLEPDVQSNLTGFVLIDDTGGSYFGQSIAVADMNKDGRDDFMAASSTLVAGVHGISGKYTTPGNVSAGINFFIDHITNRPVAGPSLNNIQNVLKTGDVNGDGRPDILLSNPNAYMSNAANAGMTYVILNPTTALGYSTNGFGMSTLYELFTAANSGYGNLDGTKGFVIEGAASNYANNAQVVDLNMDKKNDIVIAAPGYSSNTGAIYVVNGRTKSSWKTRSTASSATPANWPKIDLTDFNQ